MPKVDLVHISNYFRYTINEKWEHEQVHVPEDNLFYSTYPTDKINSYFSRAGTTYKAIANTMTLVYYHFHSYLDPDRLDLSWMA